MRKIEQRMVNAINNKVNYRESNTEVIIEGANVFVSLYDTYIYAKVRGKVYFSDGGCNTATTSENVSERKEIVSTAKVVAISIGVPSCLDIPPDNMRLDIAANKPFPTAVGDCLCGVGKVVHTLPLPPPRSKRMSELITYTNFNTS